MKNYSLFKSKFVQSIFCLIILIGFQGKSHAQLEIKTSPIFLLFEVGTLSLEYGFNETWSMEVTGFVADGIGTFYVDGKYYFNPEKGTDGFHVGAFVRTAESEFGIGFLAGKKWVSKENIVLELGLGIGRSFGDIGAFDIGVVPYYKLEVGYRFKTKPKQQ